MIAEERASLCRQEMLAYYLSVDSPTPKDPLEFLAAAIRDAEQEAQEAEMERCIHIIRQVSIHSLERPTLARYVNAIRARTQENTP